MHDHVPCRSLDDRAVGLAKPPDFLPFDSEAVEDGARYPLELGPRVDEDVAQRNAALRLSGTLQLDGYSEGPQFCGHDTSF